MPAGIGYPGGSRGSGLAGQALARQGVPEEVMPGGMSADSEAISEVLQMLKGGQVGADRLMQLLAMLAASTTGQMQGGGAGRQERPRRQGRDRQMRQRGGQGAATIRGLLG